MAWLDLFSLLATIGVFAGVIYAIIFVTKTINEGVASTQESLKSKGLHVTSSGVSIKTSKRFDREDYVDATQRGVVKAMQSASIRRNDSSSPGKSVLAHPIEREVSGSSVKSTSSEEKKKKRSMFGSKSKK
ncbi:hypothetical protein BDZ97DRAFT_1920196 [Flammula alnicola]|nr:hypothetical protein BDZ97DRAFT_1920196 [Flammula alnicola]